MGVTFLCQHCGSRRTVPDALYDAKIRGRSVKITCTACGQKIPVDGTQPPPVLPSQAAPEPPEPETAFPPRIIDITKPARGAEEAPYPIAPAQQKAEAERWTLKDAFKVLASIAFIVCLLIPIAGVLATVGRAIYLAIAVPGGGQHVLVAVGIGAGLGSALGLLSLFSVQTDRYERTVDLVSGRAGPWEFVGSTIEGPFGRIGVMALLGAVVGLLFGVWG